MLRPVQHEIHHPTVVEMGSDSDSSPKSETEWKTRACLYNSSHKSCFKCSAGVIRQEWVTQEESLTDACLQKALQYSRGSLGSGDSHTKETLHIDIKVGRCFQKCSSLAPHWNQRKKLEKWQVWDRSSNSNIFLYFFGKNLRNKAWVRLDFLLRALQRLCISMIPQKEQETFSK